MIRVVVSYRNSTSNHNTIKVIPTATSLYLIEILHQTTTSRPTLRTTAKLYLIEILHQTTTHIFVMTPLICCILSKFYIKPQQGSSLAGEVPVVSYRNSTSNHNKTIVFTTGSDVVSYRNSTSNHN